MSDKHRIWYHVSDGCDGSISVNFFDSKEAAEAYAEADEEQCGQSFEGNVSYHDIEIVDGKLSMINPVFGEY